MTLGESGSDDDCICVGTRAQDLRGPLQRADAMNANANFMTHVEDLVTAATGPSGFGMELDAVSNHEDLVLMDDADVNTCGSPAAAAKRRALENRERSRNKQVENRSSLAFRSSALPR